MGTLRNFHPVERGSSAALSPDGGLPGLGGTDVTTGPVGKEGGEGPYWTPRPPCRKRDIKGTGLPGWFRAGRGAKT